MLHNYNITSYQYPFIPKIRHTIADERDILTCYCKQDISIICIFP